MKNNSKGFTVVEMLVALAIMLILLAVGVSAFSGLARKSAVNKEADIVLSYIDKAHRQTVAAVEGSSFGVRFSTSTADFFEGSSYAAASEVTSYALSPGISLSISLSGGEEEVVFERLTGEASATGTIDVVNDSGTASKRIIINASGLAEIQ